MAGAAPGAEPLASAPISLFAAQNRARGGLLQQNRRILAADRGVGEGRLATEAVRKQIGAPSGRKIDSRSTLRRIKDSPRL